MSFARHVAVACLLLLPHAAHATQEEVDPSIPAVPMTPPPSPAEEVVETYNAIKLQGLNKVTAHISTLYGPMGTVLRFDNLEIIARRCWKAPPDEQPENAALLEIWENKDESGPQRIFLGWMFASSPGLSSLEHPVYDITVLSCEKLKEDEEGEETDSPAKAEKPEKSDKAEKDAAPAKSDSTAKPH